MLSEIPARIAELLPLGMGAEEFEKWVEDLTRLSSAAMTEMPIFLAGGRGAGVAILVEAIHKFSTRAAGKLVGVRCGLSSADVLTRKIVGTETHRRSHVRVPAGQARGDIQKAQDGTLFVEQIQHVPMAAQDRLMETMSKTPDGQSPRAARLVASGVGISEKWRMQAFRGDLMELLSQAVVCIPAPCETREGLLRSIAAMKECRLAAGLSRFVSCICETAHRMHSFAAVG